MRYTIEGLSQQKIFDLGLDNTDALIIRWFLDFKATGKMAKVFVSDQEYFWVKYEAVINEFPVFRITNRESIARRFKKYVQAGIMTSFLKKDKSGTYSCFNTTDAIFTLMYEHSTQKSNGVDLKVDPPIDVKVDPPIDVKVDPKDPSTNINQSTNNQVNVVNGDDLKKHKSSLHEFNNRIFNINNINQIDKDFVPIATYYFDKYIEHYGEEHPAIKMEYWNDVIKNIWNHTDDDIADLIDIYFDDKSLDCDHNIIHFSQENILLFRQYC